MQLLRWIFQGHSTLEVSPELARTVALVPMPCSIFLIKWNEIETPKQSLFFLFFFPFCSLAFLSPRPPLPLLHDGEPARGSLNNPPRDSNILQVDAVLHSHYFGWEFWVTNANNQTAIRLPASARARKNRLKPWPNNLCADVYAQACVCVCVRDRWGNCSAVRITFSWDLH